LAKKLLLTPPKTTGAIKYFKIKDDPDCFKHLKVGNVPFGRYSLKAIEKIREGLKTKSIDDIWREK